jgi:hypothetical protein
VHDGRCIGSSPYPIGSGLEGLIPEDVGNGYAGKKQGDTASST